MIRIIDEKPDASVIKNAICKNCGVKLEFVPLDVKSKSYRDIDGSSDTHRWINCPKCNYEITVRL